MRRGEFSVKRDAVSAMFDALYALTDLRQVFRATKPTHEMDHEQRRTVKALLEEVKQSIAIIEEELVGA
jgi:hypothetical protein